MQNKVKNINLQELIKDQPAHALFKLGLKGKKTETQLFNQEFSASGDKKPLIETKDS